MATLNTRDPVQGLIDYVQDVKPYHTKILEVWVEYIYGDAINATIKDRMEMEIDILFDRTRKYCNNGWDMYVWGKMLADAFIDEIVPGTISFGDGLTIKRSEAYQLYFNYLCAVWLFNNGEAEAPIISSDQTTSYWQLSYSPVINAAKEYFANINNNFEYWYEPASRKLFKRVGQEWHEQSAFLSMVTPLDPTEMDIWINTVNMTLFVYMSGTWEENTNFYISYTAPKAIPRYPPEWISTWDRPECNPPYGGENWVYAYVTEELSFEHGNQLFLNEDIRTLVYDPAQNLPNVNRLGYPVTYKTTMTQDPDGRYKITREEVSIVTDPDNPAVKDNSYPISQDWADFSGFGIDRQRRGVRLTEFLVWKFKNDGEGMQLIADPIFNRDTFGFRVENGTLIAQSISSNGRVDIDCPYNDGQIVYFTSTNDLPTFSVLTEDYQRPIPLMRYQPYRIKKIDDRQFSVMLVKTKTQFDPVTGIRIAPAYPTYDVDTDAMGSSPYLSFVTPGNGDLYFGFGHPIPFMEVRTVRTGDTVQGVFRDSISSTTEAFPGYRYSQIRDVIIGFDDSGILRNAFVVEGDYTKLGKGEIIKVTSSASNDGDWVISKATKWTNVELDPTGIPVRDGSGRMIPVRQPAWWNEMMNGDWPRANLLGSEYYTVTTIGVSGTAPSTQYPFGNIAFRYYNFSEPTVSPNVAQAVINEKLYFGSYVLQQNPDGSWQMVPEVGVPGTSIVFKDVIKVSIQEQLEPNGYGISTIGSYDVQYYDITSFDNGPENTTQ